MEKKSYKSWTISDALWNQIKELIGVEPTKREKRTLRSKEYNQAEFSAR